MENERKIGNCDECGKKAVPVYWCRMSWACGFCAQNDEDSGETFEYEGDIYSKCDTEVQLQALLDKWSYGSIHDFETETGVNPQQILGKFFTALGKPFRIIYLADGFNVSYEERLFEDNVGDTYSGKDILEVDPLECIWEVSEIDLTKDLKLGEKGYTKIKDGEYDRENHTTDFVEVQRVK